MKCDVNKLVRYVQKATVKYIIDFVQLNVTEDRIKTKLRSERQDVLSVMNVKNDIFTDFTDSDPKEFTLNWKDATQSLIPFLSMFDDEMPDCIIDDVSITLKKGKKKVKINCSIEDVAQVLHSNINLSAINFFYEFTLDEQFIKDFNDIKKIAATYNMIFITVDENKLYLETGNVSMQEVVDNNKKEIVNKITSGLSNRVQLEQNDVDYHNLLLRFDFRGFTSLMQIVEEGNYYFKAHYNERSKLGMIFAISKDGNEIFWLNSIQQ